MSVANMAEASNKSSGIFVRAQKQLSRTKTKVLQNLGKADRTTDEQFDELVLKIDRQQESAHHLQKELKKYLHCIEALSVASKSFYSAVEESYEAEWTEEKKFRESLQESEQIWVDFVKTLQGKVMEPITQYLANFPILKSKIAKRGRKLMYYDNARHSVDVIQMAKKKDETKVHKVHEELAQAKQVYLDINNDLHKELPAFQSSRPTVFGSIFNDLFIAEKTFHGRIAEIAEKEVDITNQLQVDFRDFEYTPLSRPLSSTLSDGSVDEHVFNGTHDESSAGTSFTDSNPGSPIKQNGGDTIVYGNQQVVDAVKKTSVEIKEKGQEVVEKVKQGVDEASAKIKEKVNGTDAEEKINSTETEEKVNSTPAEEKVNGTKTEETVDAPDYPPPSPPEEDKVVDKDVYDTPTPRRVEESKPEVNVEDDIYKSPPAVKSKDAPPTVLYEVEATHPYNGEDTDELTFDTGDLIWVVPYENPEEQDEGWVMGVKQTNGVKGVFPENFTKKITQ
ncbi:myc box-dependent-interacting protein 1 isoform X2 [Patella vulgata]|uniref:myc box-dependent-interacting protein 1 isoform X2 n=1 Tax=Patella vulgata TaxID=6465 RepID=UPI0021806249|nr:myc box-dependent-interacting protein 1 isoform X2 [Patella vulgata]